MNKPKKYVVKAEESVIEGSNNKKLLEEDTYAIIPPNGGWGWLVVFCAFYCNVVVDGIQLTFGVFLKRISENIHGDYSEVALAGSLMFGVHLLMGPVCAGFSKVFGLRPVTITGSIICSFGVGITYFATTTWYLCITYGFVGGMGLGLVYMNTLVIVSLYFTSLLPIAIAIVVSGTGFGTMIFAALGGFLLRVTTWQNSFLIQSLLAASMGIAAITFKPLKPIKIKVEPPRIITEESLPLVTDEQVTVPEESPETSNRKTSIFIKKDAKWSLISLKTVQSLAWDSLLEDTIVSDFRRKKLCKCTCECPKGCFRKKEKPLKNKILILTEIKNKSSLIVKPSLEVKGKNSFTDSLETIHLSEEESEGLERNVEEEEEEEEEEEVEMSVISPADESQSYHSVFKRVEIEEKRHWCEPLKKTMIAMLDCHLLMSLSFFLYTLSGAFQIIALLIVFIYEKDRCAYLGFTEEMSEFFVIALGGANMFWRLFLGGLATIPRINYLALAVSGVVIGGIATTCSNLSSDVYFQFIFCVFFGLAMASFAVFRIVLLVDLVETNLIANATGINLLFMGVFSIISPPLFGWAMEITNSYDVIFITTGLLLTISGFMLLGLKKLRQRELRKRNKQRSSTSVNNNSNN